jgi:hypothetical protein
VKALLEKLRRLGKSTARAQHEKVRTPFAEFATASPTPQQRRLAVEQAAAIRAPDELKQLR